VSVALGAPGLLVESPRPLHAATGVRMDVAAFAGIAPRGPARVPVIDDRHPAGAAQVDPLRPRARSVAVPVESFEAYRRRFGGFEGPGRLPRAVDAFFAQGGRRAYVVRIVHAYANAAQDAGGVAFATVEGVAAPGVTEVMLRARDEGAWGNALRAELRFDTWPAPAELPPASLLRLTLADGGLELVDAQAPLPAGVRRVELVTVTLDLDDGDGRRERFPGLGLRAGHPRWVGDVLADESALAWPDAAWAQGALAPHPDLRTARTGAWEGGADRWDDVVHDDCFDRRWVPGDEPDVVLGAGIHALLAAEDVASVGVPDLYEPEPFTAPVPVAPAVRPAGPEFEPCLEPDADAAPPAPRAPLAGLLLDPRDPADLERIVALQGDVVALAEHARWTALLDVPPGLTRSAVLRWREAFDSAYAAAYHPWLRPGGPDRPVARGPQGPAPSWVPPSAVAAGILAATERRSGVQAGPANALAAGVVDVEQELGDAQHDELHLAGIDVFRLERAGVRLTAARTLSRDPRWRQLSVRRLVTMIARALREQIAWSVFEPNGPALQAELRHTLDAYLRELHRGGALAGATPQEGFFVRCDAATTPRAAADAGRLVAEVGLAPVEPVEYVLLRLERGPDGTVEVTGA